MPPLTDFYQPLKEDEHEQSTKKFTDKLIEEDELDKDQKDAFKIVIALAVEAIPEGLPAVVTTPKFLHARTVKLESSVVKVGVAIPVPVLVSCDGVVLAPIVGVVKGRDRKVKSVKSLVEALGSLAQ
ncbi:hypothetical protein V6N12_074863 [Hibiscus sabdariffa]|uniref:Uncharacterized protein n=1 Tax=Hibiscus sabdariffa TaxID=183260 RepID=A0ABR2D2N0_9ROSI